MSVSRRGLLIGTGGLIAASAVGTTDAATESKEAGQPSPQRANSASAGNTKSATKYGERAFNGEYRGEHLDQIAFPLGGIGAGMICLEGSGALTKFSVHNRSELTSEPLVFPAIAIKGPQPTARVLEGPLPKWKLRPSFLAPRYYPAMGPWGLPRFREASFEARFPFARVRLHDPNMPVAVEITGWSPFSPGDADNASLPVAGLEYQLSNRSVTAIDAVFSFNCVNLMATSSGENRETKSADRVLPTTGGVILSGSGANAAEEGRLAVWTDDPAVQVNHSWFRGQEPHNFDTLQMVWNDIAFGKCYARAPTLDDSVPGATLFVPVKLAPDESRTVRICFAWYVPRSTAFSPDARFHDGKFEAIQHAAQTYQPWYSGRFADIEAVKSYWTNQYARLKSAAEKFSDAFYDSTLPPEVVEAVAANLTILKSPTVLRQTDGRIWAWEGVADGDAAGPGNCTHVWNYAQAMPHLFPALERTLRETEFGDDLGRDGFQAHRAALPIRPIGDTDDARKMLPAAGDGQPGTIIRVYREWRISGDTDWLRALWPKVRAAMDYCTATWDPDREGWIKEHHLNTYDVEFWGPDSLCTSLYLGALQAVVAMGTALGHDVTVYTKLLHRGRDRIERDLFNGEYFHQRIEWEHLRTSFPPPSEAGEWNADYLALAGTEGPAYQYGQGCLADGVLGDWACYTAGLGDLLDRKKVESHLLAVYRYNFRTNLLDHADTMRPYLACGDEAGLLVCSWPRGQRPSLPMMYADEVWTGIEYQVASHLIALGKLDQGLAIVRACRARYDGRIRNPFDEIEALHWYARAMSSYALLQACSGARFDAVVKVLYLQPTIKGDFRSFLSTATGFGTVGIKDGKPFLEVVAGEIPYRKIQYQPAGESHL